MMKKTILTLVIGSFFLFACNSEQRPVEQTNDIIAEQIDDAIDIVDKLGSMKLTIKGESVTESLSASGRQGVFSAKQIAANRLTGQMKTNDSSADLRFSFAPTLGFQSLDSRDVEVTLAINKGDLNTNATVKSGKVSLRRAKPGDFLVGNITGVAEIDGKNHSVFCEFQVPYRGME